MNSELLLWTMVAIVGTVGVLKNLIDKGGKKVWTIVTIVVGSGIAFAAMKLPIDRKSVV